MIEPGATAEEVVDLTRLNIIRKPGDKERVDSLLLWVRVDQRRCHGRRLMVVVNVSGVVRRRRGERRGIESSGVRRWRMGGGHWRVEWWLGFVGALGEGHDRHEREKRELFRFFKGGKCKFVLSVLGGMFVLKIIYIYYTF